MIYYQKQFSFENPRNWNNNILLPMNIPTTYKLRKITENIELNICRLEVFMISYQIDAMGGGKY